MLAQGTKTVNTIGPQLRQEIESRTGEPLADIRPFATGHNAQIFIVDLTDGRRLIAKVATAENAKLDLEGWMLGYLSDNSNLPVPRVFSADRKMILMSYLPDGGGADVKAQGRIADMLAGLHNIRSVRYGLERDTVIGPLRQPNEQSADWIEFFRDSRLLYMARMAWDEKKIDTKLMTDIDRLAGKLDTLLGSGFARPSLIHGDLWSGNILVNQGQVSGFIDPAIYYADPEIELAFISLFGTFGEAFFKRYAEHHPVRDGFLDARRDIYNLYPLLVHVRLYGASYRDKVHKIVKRFV